MSEEIAATSSEPSAPQEVVVVEQNTPSLEDTLSATWDKISARDNPERGEGGRFAAKAGAETATPAPEVPGSPQAAPAPEPATPAIAAPQSLPEDVKGLWSTLPRNVQESWAKRELEASQKITANGEQLKVLRQYEESLAPHAERVRAANTTPHEYVRALFEAETFIEQQPVEAIRRIAAKAGLDLGQLGLHGTQQPNPNSDIIRELNAVKAQLAAFQQQSVQERVKQAEQTVESFKKDKPYFDEVEPLMTKLYEPGMDLDKLYDMAVNASPEVRAKRDIEAKAAADKKAAEEAKERQSKDAKVATFAKRPGSTPTAPVKGKTWMDTFDNKAREVRSR